jgi:hypothetical protein
MRLETEKPWLVSGFFLLFFSWVAVEAVSFSGSARIMPLVVAAPGAVLSLLQLLRDISARTGSGTAEESKFKAAPQGMIAWLCLLVLCCIALGLSLGTGLFISLFLLFRARYPLLHALAIGGGFAALQFLVFTLLLDIQLYRGAIAGYIGQ